MFLAAKVTIPAAYETRATGVASGLVSYGARASDSGPDRQIEDLAPAVDGAPRLHALSGTETIISSKCQMSEAPGRSRRRLRAKTGPNFRTRRRTVSSLASTPRSAK